MDGARKSQWVPDDWKGKTFPPGAPENPLRGAFLGLTDDGVGLHGTAKLRLTRDSS